MRIVLDSSTLISLAWSGQLSLLPRLPVEPVIIRSVYAETVTEGRSRGHADAVAIERALSDVAPSDDPAGASVDAMVLAMAIEVGALATNDAAIGRRAASVGTRWLRTADLVVLGVRTSTIDRPTGRAAIEALANTRRITAELQAAYLEDLT